MRVAPRKMRFEVGAAVKGEDDESRLQPRGSTTWMSVCKIDRYSIYVDVFG